MIHCKLDFPEKLREESIALREAYWDIDPNGEFDEAKWQAFFDEHASEELKALKRKHNEIHKYYEELEKKTGVKVMYG